MSVLGELLESRDSLQTELDELFGSDESVETRSLTPQQEERATALLAEIKDVDVRLDEESAKAARSEKLNEARRLAGVGTVDAQVVAEPKTYEPEAPHSYFMDLARASNPMFKGHQGAVERLQRHGYEMAKDATLDPSSPEGRSVLKQVREQTRSENAAEHREEMRRFRAAGESEFRAPLTTGGGATLSAAGGSGASMVIPPALTSDWVPYRQPGRTFADTIHKEALPESGMTLYIPNVTGASSVASQTENTALSETSPAFGFLSGAVVTEAGQVEISQQILDRAGPGISFDRVIADSLRRALAPVVDLYCLTQSLAGAGSTVTNTGTFAVASTSGTGGLYGKVSGAKAAARTAAGTFLEPNALFMQPTRWEFVAGWADANGRPLVNPEAMGAFQAAATAAGTGQAGVDSLGSTGKTNYTFNTLPVYQDFNIPAPASGNDQVVVLDSEAIWLFEGTPTARVVPQTKANQLTVYIQLYEYLAVVPIYPLGVQTLSGTYYAAPTF